MQPNSAPPLISGVIKSLSVPDRSSAYRYSAKISWEIMDLEKHIPLIYKWVQLPYAKTFWQMDHFSCTELYKYYEEMLAGQNTTSLIGMFNDDPICQVEVYDCEHDEISRHYAVEAGDVGLHFLMAPHSERTIHGISLQMMRSMLSILLSHESVIRVMGEPDIKNEKANALVRKAGFRFLQQITMSYKTANLYECKAEFLSR